MVTFWISLRRRFSSLAALVLLLAVQTAYSTCGAPPANAQTEPESAQFAEKYTQLSKHIMLSAIELERFSLHFRLVSAKQPKSRKIRYFLGQETGSACGLAFEITAVDQFNVGRNRPLQIDKMALRTSLNAAMTGAIIAGSSSAFELGANAVQAVENHRKGYDHQAADRHIVDKLKQLDQLLSEREALVQANSSSPAYDRAVAEGRVLRAMRNAFSNEYAHFSADTKGYAVAQNSFYALNATYNTISAIASRYAYNAIRRPYLNGTANILFITTGGIASATPIISTTLGNYVKRRIYKRLATAFNLKNFDAEEMASACKHLEAMPKEQSGLLMVSLPITSRAALYSQSSTLFDKQLDNETQTVRKLEKVALQNSLLGPVIGSLLGTQGVLGTYGYYHYALRPRKQIGEYYRGSVVGTVGTGMAVVGNAAALAAGLAYDHKLKKEHCLPEQLINDRLSHLDELQKIAEAL